MPSWLRLVGAQVNLETISIHLLHFKCLWVIKGSEQSVLIVQTFNSCFKWRFYNTPVSFGQNFSDKLLQNLITRYLFLRVLNKQNNISWLLIQAVIFNNGCFLSKLLKTDASVFTCIWVRLFANCETSVMQMMNYFWVNISFEQPNVPHFLSPRKMVKLVGTCEDFRRKHCLKKANQTMVQCA